MHAPASSQPVAPQMALEVRQLAAQHCPVPSMPQRLDRHEPLDVQAVPSANPPVVALPPNGTGELQASAVKAIAQKQAWVRT
jgi:hypothetical protein